MPSTCQALFQVLKVKLKKKKERKTYVKESLFRTNLLLMRALNHSESLLAHQYLIWLEFSMRKPLGGSEHLG